MKKIYSMMLLGGALLAAAPAQADTYVLDLNKATTPLEFEAETGAWTGTYDDDAESIVSQCYEFLHSSMSDWDTWWGFTASNSADNSIRENFIKYQFSNMAKGGIALNEDGTVKLDSYGAPVVSDTVPYIVAYYNAYMSRRPVDVLLADGKTYDAVGCYVNLTSYPYYSIEQGDAYSRAFTNGDHFTLTIHGVAADETEKTVELDLASYANGELTINRGWRYVDLTELGAVNEIYFTMKSTDSGAYGDNTPGYFALDKLIVKDSSEASVASLAADQAAINYDRASHTVYYTGAEYAAVYNAMGQQVMSSEAGQIDLSSLERGVYVVKAGNSKVKVAR